GYYKWVGSIIEHGFYNFILDQHIYEHGYSGMITPHNVKSEVMYCTEPYPKFKQEADQVVNTDLKFVTTAEFPLTNYDNDEI
ncbi:serine--tRNA ligase, partial [Enterococcus lactis]|nr:serine--tRNA ligase [Enterococcus lactis]